MRRTRHSSAVDRGNGSGSGSAHPQKRASAASASSRATIASNLQGRGQGQGQFHSHPANKNHTIAASASASASAHNNNATSNLPSWCKRLRREPPGSKAAYAERVTTSTGSTELRWRQESMRFWNRKLEEASARAFAKLVAPVGSRIRGILEQQQQQREQEQLEQNEIEEQQQEEQQQEQEQQLQDGSMAEGDASGGESRSNANGEEEKDADAMRNKESIFTTTTTNHQLAAALDPKHPLAAKGGINKNINNNSNNDNGNDGPRGIGVRSKRHDDDDDDDKDDWEYCRQLFGVSSSSKSSPSSSSLPLPLPLDSIATPSPGTAANTFSPGEGRHEGHYHCLRHPNTNPHPHPNPDPRPIHYPREVLPVFVVNSPLISNCFKDRSKICHALWRQLNSLPNTLGGTSYSRSCSSSSSSSSSGNPIRNQTICLYLPRLLSSWSETLKLLWDGLLHHYENTHDAPDRDLEHTLAYVYAFPGDPSSRRHSYHRSKRDHYETAVAKTTTTTSGRGRGGIAGTGVTNRSTGARKQSGTTTGSKKQRSLQDFFFEFLEHVFEEPEEFRDTNGNGNGNANGNRHDRERARARVRNNNNNSNSNNLVILLEDPRVVHTRAPRQSGRSEASYGNASANVHAHANVHPHAHTNATSGRSHDQLVQTQLLETLASWRELHGIPVSLVVLNHCTTNETATAAADETAAGSSWEELQRNVLLNPSLSGGRFGIRTLRCSIPSEKFSAGTGEALCSDGEHESLPSAMAAALWSGYFLEALADTPMPLLVPPKMAFADGPGNINSSGSSSGSSRGRSDACPAAAFLALCGDTLGEEASCSAWVRSLRAQISTHFYTRRGSFVWDALQPRTAAYHSAEAAELAIATATTTTATTTTAGGEAQLRSNLRESLPGLASRGTMASDRVSGSGSGSDRNDPFEIGTDAVRVFGPELVAWCSAYPKAHRLLSAAAGETKSDMTLGEKCDALVECYRLLRPPPAPSSLPPTSNSPSGDDCDHHHHYRRPEKRQKAASSMTTFEAWNGGGTGGNLHFWWSVSCALLPLRILSLTTSDGPLSTVSSAAGSGRHRGRSHGRKPHDSNANSNVWAMDPCCRWVLGRLAEVYLLLAKSQEQQEHQKGGVLQRKPIDSETNGTGGQIRCPSNGILAPGSSRMESVEAEEKFATAGNVESQSEPTTQAPGNERVSENFVSEYCDTVPDHPDFVESTLRRYLQRGRHRNETTNHRPRGHTESERRHFERIRQLAAMVRELVVVVDALAGSRNASATTRDDRNKIRSGIAQDVLEMNRIALGEVQHWTRKWMEYNPLMAAQGSRDSRSEEWGLDRGEAPTNFRRRILENLPPGARELYEALEGRLSVERDEWYRSFDGTPEDFVVGVWTLQQCGLIRPKFTKARVHQPQRGKLKRTHETVSYEKVAVVWC